MSFESEPCAPGLCNTTTDMDLEGGGHAEHELSFLDHAPATSHRNYLDGINKGL